MGIHGDAFVVQPTILHWMDYAGIARDTRATVVVPMHPLAPEGTADEVIPQMADLMPRPWLSPR